MPYASAHSQLPALAGPACSPPSVPRPLTPLSRSALRLRISAAGGRAGACMRRVTTAGSIWTPRRDHTIFANYGGALENDTSLPGDYVPVLSVHAQPTHSFGYTYACKRTHARTRPPTHESAHTPKPLGGGGGLWPALLSQYGREERALPQNAPRCNRRAFGRVTP